MWRDEEPIQKPVFVPPLSMALGVDTLAASPLMGGIAAVVCAHKEAEIQQTIFRIADLHLGDGHIVAGMVDAMRNHLGRQTGVIQVSGIDSDAVILENARVLLDSHGIPAVLHPLDAASCPAAMLRNRLQCAGGADVVMFAHAAYPHILPESKLSRMIDRLGDVVAAHGVIITLHHHGPADVDDISQLLLGYPVMVGAGLTCNTQSRLERGFQEAKLHSFSITLPNIIKLPANPYAIEAVFSGRVPAERDAEDMEEFRGLLEAIVGGDIALRQTIADMDIDAKQRTIRYFTDRIAQTKGNALYLTAGGGQMIMAFRSAQVAQSAFSAINAACAEMTPPAIALPISSYLMPEFDSRKAHADWRQSLARHGIMTPPRVCRVELDNATE